MSKDLYYTEDLEMWRTYEEGENQMDASESYVFSTDWTKFTHGHEESSWGSDFETIIEGNIG